MKEDITKLDQLVRTDEEFQGKLKAALEAWEGERTEQAAFDGVVAPLAAEYGLEVSFEELKACVDGLDGKEVPLDELEQVAGAGTGDNPELAGGTGIFDCYYFGIGFGGTANGGCVFVGGSNGGSMDVCDGSGVSL